jgi:hypothetical protein
MRTWRQINEDLEKLKRPLTKTELEAPKKFSDAMDCRDLVTTINILSPPINEDDTDEILQIIHRLRTGLRHCYLVPSTEIDEIDINLDAIQLMLQASAGNARAGHTT